MGNASTLHVGLDVTCPPLWSSYDESVSSVKSIAQR